MSIAITEDHKALASTAASFLLKTNARGEARALLEAPEEGCRRSGRTWSTSAGSGCTSPRSTADRATACPSWSSWSRSWAAPWRRALRAHRHAPAVLAAAGDEPSCKAQLLPGLADGSSLAASRCGLDVQRSGSTASGSAGGARRRIGPRRPARRRATTCSWWTSAIGVSVDHAAQPRPDPAHVATSPSTARPSTVLPGARRIFVDLARTHPVGRGGGRGATSAPRWPPPTPRSACSSAGPIAHVPGRQAPLRQHGRRHRDGDGRRVGRGAGRRHRRRPAHLRRRGGGHRWPRRPPTCAPTSTRRCTAASPSPGSTTPTSTCAGPPRCSATCAADEAAEDLVDLTRRGVERAKAIELPPEAEPIRDEVRRLRRQHQGPPGRRAADPADRDRLRDAALAQAVRAARPAPSSSS